MDRIKDILNVSPEDVNVQMYMHFNIISLSDLQIGLICFVLERLKPFHCVLILNRCNAPLRSIKLNGKKSSVSIHVKCSKNKTCKWLIGGSL